MSVSTDSYRTTWEKLRLSLSVSGAFLFLSLLAPMQVRALDSKILDLPKEPITTFDDNKKKLDNLKATFEYKQLLIKDKQKKLEVTIKETQEISQTKESLATEVESIQAEVADLQAKLAEKQRIEALRMVVLGAYELDSNGNGYVWGNCTWYVKKRRPDIGNAWGNANHWLASARSAGFKTGSMAKTGAIGVTSAGPLGHVVYVEGWDENGTITISEMNYNGLGVKDTRVANESDFMYIYEKPL